MFSKLYILTICKHCCFKQGCNFTDLFRFITDLLSPKFLYMDEGIVEYKVVVFRIDKRDFIFLLFPQFLLAKSYKLI